MPLSSPMRQEERSLFYREFEDVVRIKQNKENNRKSQNKHQMVKFWSSERACKDWIERVTLTTPTSLQPVWSFLFHTQQ